MKQLVSILTFALLGSAVQADVQISVQDFTGNTSTFTSNGQKVRVDGGKMSGYAIIDHASGELFMVQQDRNEILRSGVEGAGGDNAAAVSVMLKDQGSGHKIAGYATRKYAMTADGESCGSVYASKELLGNADVKAIFDAMRSMQRFARKMTGSFGSFMSVCQRAGMQMSDAIESSGAPLRIVDVKGQLLSEVRSVDTARKLAGNHFDLPAGMAMVDMTEQINKAAEQTQQVMDKMPNMEELMKQIQQGGGQMTEEMQQQLQQMMKQLQQ
jgi:hypothetical protein